MINKSSIAKSPFEWSTSNSYLEQHQGKKHYWGVRGKDYGLVESPQDRRREQPQHHQMPLEDLNS
jgi:hypothetical protein